MATKKKMGRPKGSGGGYTEAAKTTVTPELSAKLDEAAEALGVTRAVVIRAWLEETAARKAQEKQAILAEHMAKVVKTVAGKAEKKSAKKPKD